MNLTQLAVSLQAAGMRTPALQHRATHMRLPTFWLEKLSHKSAIGGIAR